MSYYIGTWNKPLKGERLKKTEKAVQAVMPDAELVTVNIPGNNCKMWLERPDDGQNNYGYMQPKFEQARAIVSAALEQKELCICPTCGHSHQKGEL